MSVRLLYIKKANRHLLDRVLFSYYSQCIRKSGRKEHGWPN
jgi:hypothetical protein